MCSEMWIPAATILVGALVPSRGSNSSWSRNSSSRALISALPGPPLTWVVSKGSPLFGNTSLAMVVSKGSATTAVGTITTASVTLLRLAVSSSVSRSFWYSGSGVLQCERSKGSSGSGNNSSSDFSGSGDLNAEVSNGSERRTIYFSVLKILRIE